jgi:hypothetical protein
MSGNRYNGDDRQMQKNKPQPSIDGNGGVLVTPPPNVHQHLDFIELTYPLFGRQLPEMYPSHWTEKAVETKPVNGYKVAARYADGRVEMSHPDQPNMGIHVIMPAQTLKALGEDDLWLLEFFLSNGARVTRIDTALDVFDMPLDFNELWELAKAKEYECRLRLPPLRTSDAMHGDTIYFGRMKSSVFTRIYNKAAEQNYDGSWVRVETVFRHSRANNAAKLMVKRELDTGALIRGHLNLPRLQWWTDVMTMKAEKTKFDRSTGDNRATWLMKSVAPTLAKEIFLRGDGFYDDFKARVIEELVRLDSLTSGL